MNKFALLALFALIGCVVANEEPTLVSDLDEEFSEAALVPDDEDEVANLAPENMIFKQFCLDARDTTQAFLKEQIQAGTSSLFRIIITTITDAATELINANQQNIEEAAEMIKNTDPELAAPKNVESIEEAEENLEQAKQKIALMSSVNDAIKQVFTGLLDAANTQLMNQLVALRSQFTPESFKAQLDQTCVGIVGKLQQKLDSQLMATKAALRKTKGENQELMNLVITRSNLENVGCVTSKRVSNAGKFCKITVFAMSALAPLLSM